MCDVCLKLFIESRIYVYYFVNTIQNKNMCPTYMQNLFRLHLETIKYYNCKEICIKFALDA